MYVCSRYCVVPYLSPIDARAKTMNGTADELDEAERNLTRLKEEAEATIVQREEEDARRLQVEAEQRLAASEQRKKQHETLVAKINAEVLAMVQADDEEELIKLLEGGADVNVQNHLQRTPLTLAVMKSSIPLIRILLRYGADVNKPDLYGQTPLSFAVKYKRKECFDFMAESQRGNMSVGSFMYQRNLIDIVSRHQETIEAEREERERLAILYASSKRKKQKEDEEAKRFASKKKAPKKKDTTEDTTEDTAEDTAKDMEEDTAEDMAKDTAEVQKLVE